MVQKDKSPLDDQRVHVRVKLAGLWTSLMLCYIYGDYGSGTIWTLRVAGGRATGVRREGIRVDTLSSFGEDAAGELYATSLGGTVYRIAR